MTTVLSTSLMGKKHYLMSTSVRSFDTKKLINLTKEIEKAKEFPDESEAINFISMCVTNGKKYITEPFQKP
jgi:hypothetical protein